MPLLHRLSQEVLLAIWQGSRHAALWKWASILQLVAQVKVAKSELLVVSLDKVHSWQRGGKLTYAPVSATHPITRVTIDQEGISQVERLPCVPQYARSRHTWSTYIVEESSSLGGIQAQLQVWFQSATV